MPPRSWQLGLLFSVLTVAQWGLMPPLLKGLLGELDSFTIIWARTALSVLMVGLYYATSARVAWRPMLEPRNMALLAIAVVGLLGNYYGFMMGLERITPGAAQVLAQLAPLSLLIGGVFIYRERFSPLQWLGLLVVLAGLGLFFHHRLESLTDFDSFGVGMLCVVAASLAWGMFGLAQKKAIANGIGSQQVLLTIYVAGTLLYAPGANFRSVAELSLVGAGLLVAVALVMVVSYVTLAKAMACWEASRVSAVLVTTPLFTLLYVAILATVWPGFIPADPLDALSWLGAALVVLGSGVAAVARR